MLYVYMFLITMTATVYRLVCFTTVSGRGPQPPDNDIFSAEISSSSDCGNFEYHRLIQKDDNGDIVAVM